jgi:hypothetical protein
MGCRESTWFGALNLASLEKTATRWSLVLEVNAICAHCLRDKRLNGCLQGSALQCVQELVQGRRIASLWGSHSLAAVEVDYALVMSAEKRWVLRSSWWSSRRARQGKERGATSV